MRAVSVPFSPARPSRLKNEPGIFPAAYMRSSTSTVSGRKSVSRRFPAVAVARTIVSPWRTTTAPPACFAIRPVSNEISLPAISTESRVIPSLLMFCLPVRLCLGGAFCSFPESRYSDGSGQARYQFGVRRPGHNRAPLDQGRRDGHAGAHAASRLLAHALAHGCRAAVSLEAVEVEAERLGVLPQIGVVGVPRVLEQRVVELPEAALRAGGLRGGGQRHRARMLGGDREVAEGESDRRLAQALMRERAARAGEIRVDHQQRPVGLAAYVIGGLKRRRGCAAQVAHVFLAVEQFRLALAHAPRRGWVHAPTRKALIRASRARRRSGWRPAARPARAPGSSTPRRRRAPRSRARAGRSRPGAGRRRPAPSRPWARSRRAARWCCPASP